MKTQFYSSKSKEEMMEIIVDFFNAENAKTEDCMRKYSPENPTRRYQAGRGHAISDLIRKLGIHDAEDMEG